MLCRKFYSSSSLLCRNAWMYGVGMGVAYGLCIEPPSGLSQYLHLLWLPQYSTLILSEKNNTLQLSSAIHNISRYSLSSSVANTIVLTEKKQFSKQIMASYNSACLSAVEKETTLAILLDSGGQIERLIITNGGNYK